MATKPALAFLAAWLALSGSIYVVIRQTGLLVVDVQDKTNGKRLYLPVPMLLVNLAARLNLAGSHEQIRQKLEMRQKHLLAACEVLAGCPDSTFLEITNQNSTLLIVKRGEILFIDTESPEQRAHISVPIRSAGKALASLANRF